MSLNLIKKSTGSPFHLQRSIVSQSGEGGAYEEGGYTGQANYSDGGIAAAISGVGKVVGAGLSSVTAGDKNKANVKKETRLENRSQRTELKKKQAEEVGNTSKAKRMGERNARIETRKEKTTAEIKKYNEFEKPTLKSDITGIDKKEVKSAVESEKSIIK
jgi:hypothetical protein